MNVSFFFVWGGGVFTGINLSVRPSVCPSIYHGDFVLRTPTVLPLLYLTHSHTMTPFDPPRKQAY